jgi:hypothetical protein
MHEHIEESGGCVARLVACCPALLLPVCDPAPLSLLSLILSLILANAAPVHGNPSLWTSRFGVVLHGFSLSTLTDAGICAPAHLQHMQLSSRTLHCTRKKARKQRSAHAQNRSRNSHSRSATAHPQQIRISSHAAALAPICKAARKDQQRKHTAAHMHRTAVNSTQQPQQIRNSSSTADTHQLTRSSSGSDMQSTTKGSTTQTHIFTLSTLISFKPRSQKRCCLKKMCDEWTHSSNTLLLEIDRGKPRSAAKTQVSCSAVQACTPSVSPKSAEALESVEEPRLEPEDGEPDACPRVFCTTTVSAGSAGVVEGSVAAAVLT